jgi:hypothetical protein
MTYLGNNNYIITEFPSSTYTNIAGTSNDYHAVCSTNHQEGGGSVCIFDLLRFGIFSECDGLKCINGHGLCMNKLTPNIFKMGCPVCGQKMLHSQTRKDYVHNIDSFLCAACKLVIDIRIHSLQSNFIFIPYNK